MYKPFIIMLLLWILNIFITKILLKKYWEFEEIIIASTKNTKCIIFDIVALLFILWIDVEFIKWIAIIYYIIIIILSGILLIISVVTGIDEDFKNKKIDMLCWTLCSSNILREISNITILITLFYI